LNRQSFLRQLLADHVPELTDSDGRPLVEASLTLSSARICAYGDQRDGRPLNFPALQQVSRHWRSLLKSVAAEAGDGSLQAAFRASLTITTAPLLCDASSPLAAGISAGYKACIGFSQVFCHMLLSGLPPSQNLAEVASGPEFFQWLESEDWLLGQHQACAGSPSQIQELYAAFATPQPQPPRADHGELAVAAVALQSALVLATYRAVASGEKERHGLGYRLWQQARWPWMHSVTNPPGRDPDCVRNLFPGPAPPSLQTFLKEERPAMSLDERDRLFSALYWQL